jgi:hypothetical protein
MFKEEEARKLPSLLSNKNRLPAQHTEALLRHPVAAMVSIIMTGYASSLIAAATSLPSLHLMSQESGGEVKILQSVMQHVSCPPPPETAFLSGFDGSEVCMFTVSWLKACADVHLSGNAGKDVQGAVVVGEIQGGGTEVDRDIQTRIALGVLSVLFDISIARLNHVTYMGLDEMLQFASLQHQYGVGEGKYGDGNRIISLCERIIAEHPTSPAVFVRDRKGDLPLHILCSDPQGVQVGCVIVWATHKNTGQRSLSRARARTLSLSHTHARTRACTHTHTHTHPKLRSMK